MMIINDNNDDGSKKNASFQFNGNSFPSTFKYPISFRNIGKL